MGKFFEKEAMHPDMVSHASAVAANLASKALRKGTREGLKEGQKYLAQAARLTEAHTKKVSRTKNLYKKAAEDKTYPISRAYTTLGSAQSFGANRAIMGRALQGRKNIGQKGLTESERMVMKKIKKDNSGKTYRVSRFLTNPAAMSGVMAASMTPYIALLGKKPGLGMVAYGAGAGYGGTALYRATSARALKGRTQKGRVGTLPTDKRILRQLKNNE